MKCESCKMNNVEAEEKSDEGFAPYRLCLSCKTRLENYALRPLEYFNLCSIHGHTQLLSSDFYSDMNGEALQPKIKVVDTDKFPFPVTKNTVGSIEELMNYAFVRYFIPESTVEILRKHDSELLLRLLKAKVKYNRDINYKAYEIAAKVLGEYAQDWIKEEWNKRKENELLIFTEALSKCLPFNLAFEIVTTEIEKVDLKHLPTYISALLYFKSKKTLEWMESIQDKIQVVSPSFGVVAAANQLDWQTVKRWLKIGRPLSLVALDALLYCTEHSYKPSMPLVFKDNLPKLLDAEPEPIIAHTLQDYLKIDDKPRTRATINRIISNLF